VHAGILFSLSYARSIAAGGSGSRPRSDAFEHDLMEKAKVIANVERGHLNLEKLCNQTYQ
jgi:hypothetical protein